MNMAKKPTIIISMPKNSTKEEIADMRNKYKNEYKVYLIISGTEEPKAILQNFLLEGITK
jgi:hypothetical protein